MKTLGTAFQTSFTVKQCADAFEAGATDARGGAAKFAEVIASSRGHGDYGFFTPEAGALAAAHDDHPDFTVGFAVGKWVNNAVGADRVVQMYVHDRGSHREVELVSSYRLGGKSGSQKLLDKVSARSRSRTRAFGSRDHASPHGPVMAHLD